MPSDLSNDEINFIITRLALPDPSIRVATECSNQNSMGEVQAYAKLAGSSWTYYVRSLSVVIGRKASPDLNPDGDDIQIDLGPSKVVSRKHAVIQYNGNYWTITVHGRNGVKIDKANHKEGSSRLFSGNIIDIGGVQMMFVLPDAKPRVAQAFRKILALEQSHHSTDRNKHTTQPLSIRPPSLGSFNTLVTPAYNNENHTDYHNSGLSHSSSTSFTKSDQHPIYHTSQTTSFSTDYSSNTISTSTQKIPPTSDSDSLIANSKSTKPKRQKQKKTKFIMTTDGGKTSFDQSSDTSLNTSTSLLYPEGKAIFSKSQSQGVPPQSVNQDLSADSAKDTKPPFSYSTMISQAILSTEDHMMFLADIYEWISSNYAYYRFKKPGWHNSIRHSLSLSKAFERVPRNQNEPGKGMKWRIVQSYKEEFCQKALMGDIIKGKSSNSNKAFKQNTASRVAKEAAENKAISDVVKGMQQRSLQLSQSTENSFIDSNDGTNKSFSNSIQSYKSDHTDQNFNTHTIKDQKFDDPNANSTQGSQESKRVLQKDTKSHVSDNSLHIVPEKMSATTPRKLVPGSSSHVHDLRSSTKKSTLPNFQNNSLSISYSSPASFLTTYQDQYPFASISDITAGTTLATLSTPSPTHRYSNSSVPNIDTIGGMNGIINGIFSQMYTPSDSLFGFGTNNTSNNNGLIDTIGSISNVNPISAAGVSQLEAYTPDRGGSLNDSPNNSFKSHSRSKSAITPTTKYFFENTSSAKSNRNSMPPITNSTSKNSSNKESPSKNSSDDSPNHNDKLKDHKSSFQLSQPQGQGLSPSDSRKSSNERKKFGIQGPRMSNDFKSSESDEEPDSFRDQSDKNSIEFRKKSSRSSKSSSINTASANTQNHTDAINEESIRKDGSGLSPTLSFNDQEATDAIVGLRRSDVSYYNAADTPKATPLNTKNSSRFHSIYEEEHSRNSESSPGKVKGYEDSQIEVGSPVPNPLSVGDATTMGAVIVSASRTPAPVASKFQLTAPSSAQQKQLPSSFMISASPASFWNAGNNTNNQYHLSATQTPLRASNGTPGAFSLTGSGGFGGSGSITRGFSAGSTFASGVNSRLDLLKSATGETGRRKRKKLRRFGNEDDEDDDIDLDDEDSDHMGLYSPSKNGVQSTPTVKKVKRNHKNDDQNTPKQLTQLSNPKMGVGLNDKVENSKHDMANYKVGDSTQKENNDCYSVSESPATRQQSEVTCSDPETQQNDGDETEHTDSDRSTNLDEKLGKSKNGVDNEPVSGQVEDSSAQQNMADLLKTPTVKLLHRDFDQDGAEGSSSHIGRSLQAFGADDDETVEAIQGLQSLHDTKGSSNEDLQNEEGMNFKDGFHKIGKLVAAASASTAKATEPSRFLTVPTKEAAALPKSATNLNIDSLGSPQKKSFSS